MRRPPGACNWLQALSGISTPAGSCVWHVVGLQKSVRERQGPGEPPEG
jgi:hypothetical protein